MKLKEIIDGFNDIALRQPLINEYIKTGNIYDLSKERTARPSVFCVTQAEHQYDINNALMTYTFYLYYVDRLKSDESNKIEIQSAGITTINNILRTFEQTYDVEIGNVLYNVFTERFTELCAGIYATVNVNVYDDGCLEEY